MTKSNALPDDLFVAREIRQPQLTGPISTHVRRQIEFAIPGQPRGQGRHRSMMMKPKAGPAFIRNYQKNEDVEYKNLIKVMFLEAIGKPENNWFTMPTEHTPVTCNITAFFQIPKSKSNAWKAEAAQEIVPCLTKPDRDNIEKAILDALSTIAFPDDKQVYAGSCTKLYSPTPRVLVTLSWWERKESA